MLPISDNTRRFEIVAVLLTAAGKFVFMDLLHWHLPFIIGTTIFWTCYVIYQNRKKPGITKYWGFRTDNFLQTTWILLPFAATALALFTFIGAFQGTVNITWHIIPLLILYPIWGVI